MMPEIRFLNLEPHSGFLSLLLIVLLGEDIGTWLDLVLLYDVQVSPGIP